MFVSSVHFYVYILLLSAIFKIILRRALQKSEVSGSVFHFSRPFVYLHLSLPSPTFHISAPEQFIRLSLADELRIVIV